MWLIGCVCDRKGVVDRWIARVWFSPVAVSAGLSSSICTARVCAYHSLKSMALATNMRSRMAAREGRRAVEMRSSLSRRRRAMMVGQSRIMWP